jgi:hypothetical protein
MLGLAQRLADVVDTVRAGQDHVGDAVLSQQRQLVGEERPAEQRHDGFRALQGQRPQACALATGQDDGLGRRRYLAGDQDSASLISITGMPSRIG